MEGVRKKLEVQVPVKEGAAELLRYFRQQGVRMAVASSSSRSQIEANLRRSQLLEYFAAIVSGTEVEHGKPEPDIFLLAAEKIGCRPEACYVFEDSENGIRAGAAAGCVTVMVPDLLMPSAEICPHCAMICKSLTEALEIIRCR